MKVNSIQINHNCGKNFHFCLDWASEDYLFVIFKSRCTVYTPDGYVETPAGSFALFDKNLKQEYFCSQEEFVHDYIRFMPEGNFNEPILYKLPFHRIFTPNSTRDLEDLMRLASDEFYSNSKQRNELLNLYIKLILLKASEYSSYSEIALKSPKYLQFLELRSDIYRNPQDYTSVEKAAKTVFLSKPHFHTLYKKYFNTTCMNDMISARLERAKMFICVTDKTVSEIAGLCGYSNSEHFIRQFKKAVGVTPVAYRKNNFTSVISTE